MVTLLNLVQFQLLSICCIVNSFMVKTCSNSKLYMRKLSFKTENEHLKTVGRKGFTDDSIAGPFKTTKPSSTVK